MVSIDKAVVARFESKGKKFEILVDSNKALAFRKGQPYSLENVLAVVEVFRDAKTGDRCGSSELKEAFGTDDVLKVSEAILKKGEIHLTAEQKRTMVEEKRKQIIAIIARNAINPQTDLPHPPQRIEAALEEARIKVDPFLPAEEQVPDALKELRPIIPIRFEKKRVAVKFPAIYAPKAVGMVKRIAEIQKDQWLGDGSWVVVVEIPAGMITEFFDAVNGETKGEAEIKVLEKEARL